MKEFRSITSPIILTLVCSFLEAKSAKPNILWITSEDNSIEWISCYGSKNAKTPNIDQLAKEGFRYLYCFDNGAVCAPTRSSWITGMHSISTGTQPMRSGNEIPPSISFYNELLQKAGYFTSNCSKTDYNLRAPSGRNPKDFWNYSGRDYAGTWKKRKEGQPFFTVYNIGDSHESRAFGDHKDESVDPAKMILAPYRPRPSRNEKYLRKIYKCYFEDGFLGWTSHQETLNGTDSMKIPSLSITQTTGGCSPEASAFFTPVGSIAR